MDVVEIIDGAAFPGCLNSDLRSNTMNRRDKNINCCDNIMISLAERSKTTRADPALVVVTNVIMTYRHEYNINALGCVETIQLMIRHNTS